MNNLEKYVHYVQPVVQAINAHDNPSYLLQYFNLSPQDLVSDPGNNLVEFQTAAKNLPEHFNGTMPAVLAQWGEETDAALVLQVSPDHRKLFTPEVTEVLCGKYHAEHGQMAEAWENTADQTVYILLDHKYYSTTAGFEPTKDYGYEVMDGYPLDFLSRSLGLDYFLINDGKSSLEYVLAWWVL